MQRLPKQVEWVLHTMHQHGKEAFLVGGCVRDLIMNREIHDFDITTSALPNETMEIFQTHCKVIPTGIQHGTITVLVDKLPIEITTYRVEQAYIDHRCPSSVIFTENLLEDLKRRDFTMNAIAYAPQQGFYDPFQGKKDIEQHLIRSVGDPKLRLEEDALRILRALRFSMTLHFDIEEQLTLAIKQKASTLSYISKERIRSEFDQMLLSDHKQLLSTLRAYDVLEQIIPNYSIIYDYEQKTPWHIYDIFQHTDVALDHSDGYPLESKLAIVFHDLGKPHMETFDEHGIAHYKKHALISEEMAKASMKNLHYDNKTIERTCKLIYYHDYYVKPTRKILRRFLAKFDNDTDFAIQALMVQMADDQAKNMEKAKEKIDILQESIMLLKEMEKDQDQVSIKDLNVNGHDMMALGLQGKQIKDMLHYLYDIVLDDPQQNEKTYLLDIAKKKMQD
ncbi:CCA tRNA nucleotidyltransferase [[Eubacterium] hominis]|uniref:CCA tRNA nucleotidyltransferase n=1 Tax=[Eubacterium] hominis TaxID=2764325 RepID=UPI003A4E1BA0